IASWSCRLRRVGFVEDLFEHVQIEGPLGPENSVNESQRALEAIEISDLECLQPLLANLGHVAAAFVVRLDVVFAVASQDLKAFSLAHAPEGTARTCISGSSFVFRSEERRVGKEVWMSVVDGEFK